MKKKIVVVFVMTLLITASTALIGTTIADLESEKTQYQPVADYGDAPDPTFPSFYASGGPFHLNVNDCYVGWTATAEPDALVPDLDADDGTPLIFASNAPGFWTGWVYVPITVDQSAPYINRYLNVLIDCDSSGTWCNQPGEWIVRNYKVYYLPGQTYWYCIGGFSWVTFYSGLHWLRVTVSDQKISANTPNGWDGSDPTGGAGFPRGETEDWELQWYYNPHGPVPPYDPTNPPAPLPIPECNKAANIYQAGPLPHKGHSGTWDICVENTGTHPIHITEGPFLSGPWGSDINIPPLPSMACTWLQPGEKACVTSTWEFVNPPENKAWADLEVVYDPNGQYVICANVGDYSTPTSEEGTAAVFVEGIADLCCEGNLEWTDVPPGTEVCGEFIVKNCDELGGSFLNWQLVSEPEWGVWEIEPDSGHDLPDGETVTVTACVTAPDEPEEEFTGTIKICNSDNPDDCCEINVYLKTPRDRAMNTPFFNFLQNHPNMFPILRLLLLRLGL